MDDPKIKEAFGKWYDSQNSENFQIAGNPQITNITQVVYRGVFITELVQERKFIEAFRPLSEYQFHAPLKALKVTSDYSLWENEYYFPAGEDESKYSVLLPDTLVGSACYACNDVGKVLCRVCDGVGRVICSDCFGSRVDGYKACRCNRKGCRDCGGTGLVRCGCNGETLPCHDCGNCGYNLCEICNGNKKAAHISGIEATNYHLPAGKEIYSNEIPVPTMRKFLTHKKNRSVSSVTFEKLPVSCDDLKRFPADLIDLIETLRQNLSKELKDMLSVNRRHIGTKVSLRIIEDVFKIQYQVNNKSFEVVLQSSTGLAAFTDSPWMRYKQESISTFDDLLNRGKRRKALKLLHEQYADKEMPQEIKRKRSQLLTGFVITDIILILGPYLFFFPPLILSHDTNAFSIFVYLIILWLLASWVGNRRVKRRSYGKPVHNIDSNRENADPNQAN